MTSSPPPEPAHNLTGLPSSGAMIAGKYLLGEVIGVGGMGVVLAGEHVELQQPVAVKLLLPRVALYPGARDRFVREARAAARIPGEHAVRILDVGTTEDGVAYMTMERLEGSDLSALLQQRGQLPATEAVDFVLQAIEGVSAAHAVGVVHRDLKPSNLLLLDQPDGSLYVKVADFGIAKALKSDLAVDRPEDTSDGWMLGSPAYMSPEQMGGGGVDARSDMWALGVIIYECLTGRLPFPGRSVAELIINMSVGRFDPPSNVRPTLPIELDAWFVRALGKLKEQRFPRVEEMAQSFRAAIVGRPVRQLPRLAQRCAGFVGLAIAIFALRPAPSDALLDHPASPIVEAAPIVAPRSEQPRRRRRSRSRRRPAIPRPRRRQRQRRARAR